MSADQSDVSDSPRISGSLPSCLALFPLLVWGLCQHNLNFFSSQFLPIHLLHCLIKQNDQFLIKETHGIVTQAKRFGQSTRNSPLRQHPSLQNEQKRSLSISSLVPAFQTGKRSFQEALQSLLLPASSQRAPLPVTTEETVCLSHWNAERA